MGRHGLFPRLSRSVVDDIRSQSHFVAGRVTTAAPLIVHVSWSPVRPNAALIGQRSWAARRGAVVTVWLSGTIQNERMQTLKRGKFSRSENTAVVGAVLARSDGSAALLTGGICS